ncbi:hypothetical protein [Spartinivicinus ruber]|uniref:hypothetical protein n=1 Tax=Spartinivicinus ruber TaxID=2683272 RepID=UPI0013D6BA7F|nr:hypothetical protein [Spartinivicinus ruber]
MVMYVMLSVDLSHVSSTARDKFNNYLKENQWTKLSLSTTWIARFKHGVSVKDALQGTKIDVEKAANYANIINYEVAAHVGDQKPEQWH